MGEKNKLTVSYGVCRGPGGGQNYVYRPLVIDGSTDNLDGRLQTANIQVVSEGPGVGATEVKYNYDEIGLVSALRTATASTAGNTITGRGIIVTLNVTAIAATGSLTVSLEGRDPVSLNYHTVATFSPVTTVSLNAFTVYPGIVEVAGSRFNMILPSVFRITCTPINAVDITYSVGYNVIV